MTQKLADPKLRVHESMLMFFSEKGCVDCKFFTNDLVALSKALDEKPKVVRVDCTDLYEICDIFMNWNEKSNATYPTFLMVTKERTHVYRAKDGSKLPLDKEKLADFAANPKQYPVHGDNISTKEVIFQGHEYLA